MWFLNSFTIILVNLTCTQIAMVSRFDKCRLQTANVTQWSHKTFSVEPLCGYSYCTCGHQFCHDYIMKSLNFQQNNLQNYVFCHSTIGIPKLFSLQIIFKCKGAAPTCNLSSMKKEFTHWFLIWLYMIHINFVSFIISQFKCSNTF